MNNKCPHCGYCSHCGRSNGAAPWTVWSGGNALGGPTGTLGQTIKFTTPTPQPAAKPEWVLEMFDRLIKLEEALNEEDLDD